MKRKVIYCNTYQTSFTEIGYFVQYGTHTIFRRDIPCVETCGVIESKNKTMLIGLDDFQFVPDDFKLTLFCIQNPNDKNKWYGGGSDLGSPMPWKYTKREDAERMNERMKGIIIEETLI